MNRVLVTGASGFIGRWALPALERRGYEVHAVDLHPAPPGTVGATWHVADLHDRGAVQKALDAVRPTHLLHLAWYVVPKRFWASPDNLDWIGTSLHLVRAFREAGGERAVIAGTCAEYDPDQGWCSEAVTPLAPNTLYGTAKDALRRVVEAYAKESGLAWAWGRIFLLYGPNEHPDRLVPAVARAVLRGEPTRCTHGNQVRDLMHVEDVADAFAALLDAPAVHGPVNIATGHAITLRNVVHTVARAASAPELARFGDVPAPAGESPFLVADVRRLRDEVGFTPRHQLATGLKEVVEWWRMQEAVRR